MRKYISGGLFLVSAGVLVVILSTHSRANSAFAVTAAPLMSAAADEAEVVEDNMHEFMEYVFQPTYKRLKVTMAKVPANNAGWKAMKSDSLILAESCNLLFVRTPDKNASDWNRHAAASRADGAALYKAARTKDFSKATAAYKSMLNNCNACHRQFEKGKHILSP